MTHLSTTEVYLSNLLLMRQYQPIWEQIKKARTATLIAPIVAHKKIIKAVCKEKYQDMGWKLLCAEKEVRFELDIVVELHANNEVGSVTFTLVDVSGISINDL